MNNDLLQAKLKPQTVIVKITAYSLILSNVEAKLAGKKGKGSA